MTIPSFITAFSGGNKVYLRKILGQLEEDLGALAPIQARDKADRRLLILFNHIRNSNRCGQKDRIRIKLVFHLGFGDKQPGGSESGIGKSYRPLDKPIIL